MIVNIRSTSGSGKSHIVRQLMSRYALRQPQHEPGRKQPIGYICRADGHLPLFVAGHYETACGGCDTLNGLDYIFNLVEQHARNNYDVIFEGLIVSSDVVRCIDLKRRYTLMVVELSTSLDACVEGIRQRRNEKSGDAAKPITETTRHTADKKMTAVRQQRPRFRDAGVDFRLLDRDAALKAVLEAFNWTI